MGTQITRTQLVKQLDLWLKDIADIKAPIGGKICALEHIIYFYKGPDEFPCHQCPCEVNNRYCMVGRHDLMVA